MSSTDGRSSSVTSRSSVSRTPAAATTICAATSSASARVGGQPPTGIVHERTERVSGPHLAVRDHERIRGRGDAVGGDVVRGHAGADQRQLHRRRQTTRAAPTGGRRPAAARTVRSAQPLIGRDGGPRGAAGRTTLSARLLIRGDVGVPSPAGRTTPLTREQAGRQRRLVGQADGGRQVGR